jgi:hypothetical protein
VLPVAVEGCYDVWPRWRSWPRLWNARVAVGVGRPVPYDELMAQGAEAALDRLADEVERMRLALRRQLRRESHGLFPAPGAGDVVTGSEDRSSPQRDQESGPTGPAMSPA